MRKMNWEPATTRLSITLFGPFRVEIDGELFHHHRPPDAQMFAYLLLHHDCPVDRSEVAVCWKKEADKPFWESGARASLVRAVSTLTKNLGIESRRLQKPQTQLLRFDTIGADLDLRIWEDALVEGSVEALESVALLQRRTFLAGWDDLWVQQARERFRNEYLQALNSAARRATAHRDWKAALRAYTLLAEIDLWNDDTLRDHLTLLADRRRFQEMKKLYDAYAKHNEASFNPFDTKTAQAYRTLREAADRDQTQLKSGLLPTPLSRFIPRPADLQEICGWIRSERLVTLDGAGGIGKTRLAIAAAEALREEYYDGVWFIDLSDLQNPAEVPTQVAQALSLGENAGSSATEEIIAFLRDRETLLVFDSCEHLLQASAQLANIVLLNCPYVKILTTSRVSLGIVGELVWCIPPLGFPPSDAARGDRVELPPSDR
jgi:DNA-binding SARP family transcriptional activator